MAKQVLLSGQFIVAGITENNHRGALIQISFAPIEKIPEHAAVIRAGTSITIHHLINGLVRTHAIEQ